MKTTGFTVIALLIFTANAIEITPTHGRGSVALEFSYVPGSEPIGGLEIAIGLQSTLDISTVLLGPALTGAWSQICPELDRRGNQLSLYCLAPTIMQSTDSTHAVVCSAILYFADSNATVQSIDSVIDSARIMRVIGTTGQPLENIGLKWNAFVSAKAGLHKESRPAIGYRQLHRAYSLSFNLAATVRVVANVTDLKGRHIARLCDKPLKTGIHEVRWDGKDASGALSPAGTYFIQLKIGNTTYNRKVSHAL
jgi:hypothetical protein